MNRLIKKLSKSSRENVPLIGPTHFVGFEKIQTGVKKTNNFVLLSNSNKKMSKIYCDTVPLIGPTHFVGFEKIQIGV